MTSIDGTPLYENKPWVWAIPPVCVVLAISVFACCARRRRRRARVAYQRQQQLQRRLFDANPAAARAAPSSDPTTFGYYDPAGWRADPERADTGTTTSTAPRTLVRAHGTSPVPGRGSTVLREYPAGTPLSVVLGEVAGALFHEGEVATVTVVLPPSRPQEEGLNELGEAPPPYVGGPGTDKAEGDDVELADMSGTGRRAAEGGGANGGAENAAASRGAAAAPGEVAQPPAYAEHGGPNSGVASPASTPLAAPSPIHLTRQRAGQRHD